LYSGRFEAHGVGSVRGEQYLNRDKQFQLVYNSGRFWAGREIVIRALPNGLNITRYGFAVGRRVGKAVVRNRIKRRLREILRKEPLSPGWDIIIIARNPAAQADYHILKKSVAALLMKAGLLIGEHEGVRPRVD
jgi:ribonuclease P protein component